MIFSLNTFTPVAAASTTKMQLAIAVAAGVQQSGPAATTAKIVVAEFVAEGGKKIFCRFRNCSAQRHGDPTVLDRLSQETAC